VEGADLTDIARKETQETTTQLLVVFLFATMVCTVASTLVITYFVHNFYVAGYYTISAVFGVEGTAQADELAQYITPFSVPFDVVVAVSLIDGILKIVAIGFVIAAVINLIMSIDLGSRFVIISKNRWKNHVIICGYSLLAERVAIELAGKKVPFLVVDRDPAKIDEINEAGFTGIHEDFTSDMALKNASIETARTVMFLTYNDYDNLLGVITARHLKADINVVAMSSDSSTVTKMHRAGAGLCVIPEVLTGVEIGEAITNKIAGGRR
jgi:hypothetical protein